MAETQKISAQQRMLNFAAMTRQNEHMIGKQTVNDELSTIQFVYPKTRLLAQTYLKVDVDFNLTHASETELEISNYDLAKIIRKITMDLNNGFMPIVVSGEEMMMFNTVATHPTKMTSKSGMVRIGEGFNVLAASSDGTQNKYTFVLELKNTLNDSMLQGLILLQNNATQVTLNVDIGSVSGMLANYAGFTGTLNSVTVSPMIVTYTIPADERAFPDISILRLIQAKTTVFTSGGDNVVYLDTGTIYRKLLIYITDNDGVPLTPDKINGNIELAFNTADIPYSVTADMLHFLNADAFGERLRDGLYVFDWSSQSPLIGYGGTRDYINTKQLTQFTLKVNTDTGCKITTITEQLSTLK